MSTGIVQGREMMVEVTINRKRVAEWLGEADRRIVVMQGTRSLMLMEVGCEYKIDRDGGDIITVLKALDSDEPVKKELSESDFRKLMRQ